MRKFNYYSLNYYYETYYLAHAKLVVKLWKKNILMILNIYKALYNMFVLVYLCLGMLVLVM